MHYSRRCDSKPALLAPLPRGGSTPESWWVRGLDVYMYMYIFSLAAVNHGHTLCVCNVMSTHSTNISCTTSYTLNVKIYNLRLLSVWLSLRHKLCYNSTCMFMLRPRQKASFVVTQSFTHSQRPSDNTTFCLDLWTALLSMCIEHSCVQREKKTSCVCLCYIHNVYSRQNSVFFLKILTGSFAPFAPPESDPAYRVDTGPLLDVLQYFALIQLQAITFEQAYHCIVGQLVKTPCLEYILQDRKQKTELHEHL